MQQVKDLSEFQHKVWELEVQRAARATHLKESLKDSRVVLLSIGTVVAAGVLFFIYRKIRKSKLRVSMTVI